MVLYPHISKDLWSKAKRKVTAKSQAMRVSHKRRAPNMMALSGLVIVLREGLYLQARIMSLPIGDVYSGKEELRLV